MRRPRMRGEQGGRQDRLLARAGVVALVARSREDVNGSAVTRFTLKTAIPRPSPFASR